jgi:hypothetical protein
MDRKRQINEIFAYLKSTGRIHTQQDFAKSIGASKASVSNMLKGNEQYLTDNLFRKIGYFYPDVFSREWLETGEGKMLVSQEIGPIEKSTVVGNNVHGNGIHINNAPESEAVSLLRNQLREKEAEIVRLHGIIDKLLNK